MDGENPSKREAAESLDLDFLRKRDGETFEERYERLRAGLSTLSREDQELLGWLMRSDGFSYDELVGQFEMMLKIQHGNFPVPETIAKRRESRR